MQTSAHTDVAATAFRVYLVHSLHQTEDLLREVVSSALFYGSTAPWASVVDACRRVIKYITNCQYDSDVRGFFARGFHGLCAIEAAQDDLHQSITRARANGSNKLMLRPNLTVRNDTGYDLKAVFINNAIVALNLNDQELYNLWIQASRSEYPERFEKDHLEAAITMEANYARETDEKVVNLFRLAARSYRLAAVYSVCSTYNTQHNALSAAKRYYLAIDLLAESREDLHPESQLLWEKAITATCDAAAASLAPDATGNESSTVATHFECKAIEFADAARSARVIFADRAALKSVSDALVAADAAAKVPRDKRLWQALSAAVEHKYLLGEQYLRSLLEGTKRSSSRREAERNYFAISVGDIKGMVQRVKSCSESAIYFKTRANQVCSRPYAHLNDVSRLCWELAASHMDSLVRTCSDSLADGVLSLQVTSTQKMQSKAAGRAACIAEGVMSRAADHLDMARGCETAGRCPREAQCWRRAAECLHQSAKCMYEVMSNDKDSMALYYSNESAFTQKMLRIEGANCKAAIYLRRAYDFRAGRDPVDQGHIERIYSLYLELAALLCDERDDADEQDIVEEVEEYLEKYVDKLADGQMSDQLSVLFIEATPIVLSACRVALVDDSATEIWWSALDSVTDALGCSSTQDWNSCDLLLVRAALLALCADPGPNTKCSLLYEHAADLLTAFQSSNDQSKAYAIALAVRILSALDVPPKLLELHNKNPLTGDSLGVETMIRRHAIACEQRAECVRRLNPERTADAEARAAWEAAAAHTRKLLRLYEDQARQHFQASTQPRLLAAVAEQEVNVRCFVGAALAVRNSPVMDLWYQAIQKFGMIMRLPLHFTKKRHSGVDAVNRLADVAEAKQAEYDASCLASPPAAHTTN